MGKTLGLAIVLLVIFIFGCSANANKCAKAGEQFSKVHSEEYPESCCDGLTEWDSGMDTSISIGNECYETGAMAGSPVGTCISCGNKICDDNEDACNCQEDCPEGKNSRYQSVEEFCSSNAGKRISDECSLGMELPICSLC